MRKEALIHIKGKPRVIVKIDKQLVLTLLDKAKDRIEQISEFGANTYRTGELQVSERMVSGLPEIITWRDDDERTKVLFVAEIDGEPRILHISIETLLKALEKKEGIRIRPIITLMVESLNYLKAESVSGVPRIRSDIPIDDSFDINIDEL